MRSFCFFAFALFFFAGSFSQLTCDEKFRSLNLEKIQNLRASLGAKEENSAIYQTHWLGSLPEEGPKMAVPEPISSPLAPPSIHPELLLDRLEAFQRAAQSEMIGQEIAKERLQEILLLDAADLRDLDKPIGCCLFLGPSGVGKTMLAKLVAKHYMEGDQHCLLINMSEYSDQWTATKLLGSGQGYAGSDRGGLLTNFLQEYPRSVVILDEFEKADRKIQKLFLGCFDQGFIRSGLNEYISCSNTLFIATSNLASSQIAALLEEGMEEEEVLLKIESQITDQISPELYGRMSKAIFTTLSQEQLQQIYDLEIKKIAQRIYKKRKVYLQCDESVRLYFLSKSYSPSLGARPLIDLLNYELTAQIAHFLLKNPSIPQKQILKISIEEDSYLIELLAGKTSDANEKNDEPTAL